MAESVNKTPIAFQKRRSIKHAVELLTVLGRWAATSS
jgi:hypothetical protein